MRIISITIAIIFSLNIMSQVTNEGEPLSWKSSIENTPSYIQLPAIDLSKLMQEDKVMEQIQEGPYRIGVPIETPYNTQNSGLWSILDNGDRIWRLALHSEGAIQMSVNFDKFKIPKGARLYLYNESKSDLLGAYTEAQNQESGVLGTWFVQGDKLWIEYFEPKEAIGQGELSLENIIHCYRVSDKHQSRKDVDGVADLNDSGDCNHDVDCPIGADWESHKENNKRSVAFLNMNNGYICSGALINNAEFDYTPYFLTANHCYDGSNPSNWAMRFNWISPNPSCGTTTNSTNSASNTISGATLRAKNAATDFCLVEINNAPPTAWNLTWVGWDKTDDYPDFVVGIHHPSGDIMKICRNDTGVIKQFNGGAQTWEITAAGGGWELGVTEGGSSGSPLFDEDGRVVGQLYGGLAACNGVNDNGQKDYYGRFGVSWDGTSSSTRLRDWLDPLNSNVDFIDSYSASAGIDEYLDANILVYPNPTSNLINVQLRDVSGSLNYTFINTLGQEVIEGQIDNTSPIINVGDLIEGVYFMKIVEQNTQSFIVRKIIVQR